MSAGYQFQNTQIGAEISFRSFEIDEQNQNLSFTNVPIGLTVRHLISDHQKLLFSLYWDDVLYKDFRFKFQDGFKLPKDYDVAYEGPWSFRFGYGHKLKNNFYLYESLYFQNFSRYKRRRPEIITGDTIPVIDWFSFTTTLSWSL
jgi:long-subunit fatty acid transport protein